MIYRFHPDAQIELNEAYQYYEGRRGGLGLRFIEAVEDAIADIVEWPLAWTLLETPFRIRRLRRFPYGILYNPLEAEIVIVAIMHLHREPGYWRHRAE